MNESPSRYGGIAATMVLGTGLLLMGKIVEGMIILGVATFFLALAMSSNKALVLALGASICCGILTYKAAANEFTGRALYIRTWGRGSQGEPVSRETSPGKFRQATNILWGASGAFLLIAGIAFLVHRSTEASVGEHSAM